MPWREVCYSSASVSTPEDYGPRSPEPRLSRALQTPEVTFLLLSAATGEGGTGPFELPFFTTVTRSTWPFLKLPRHSRCQRLPLPNTLKACKLVSLKNDSLSPTSTLTCTRYLNVMVKKRNVWGESVEFSLADHIYSQECQKPYWTVTSNASWLQLPIRNAFEPVPSIEKRIQPGANSYYGKDIKRPSWEINYYWR